MSKEIATFQEVIDENVEQLDLFTTAITRVHGPNHPEVFEVRELFEAIDSKTKAAKPDKPDLSDEFTKLRRVTGSYDVPEDGCETFASVYHMLSDLDKAYQVK